jgi:hypothetical protein
LRVTNAAKKGGRPPYQPTQKARLQVEMLSGMGVPDYDIAKVMGISGPTLRKYFAEELDVGHVKATAKVAESLFKMATSGDKASVAAAIFWLKCRAGWKEDGDRDLGKREQLEQAARTAQAGTAWDGLLQ